MKAVFFDKDGTLVKDVPYNVRPELIELLSGAAEAVQNLQQAGWKIFVVSNQSGVARGFFEEKDLADVWERLNELCGVQFDGFYFCPHLENGKIIAYSIACNCRKPKAGLILQAARENNLELEDSWLIGDSASDIAAGQSAGCQTILIGENDVNCADQIMPHFTVENLSEAVELIFGQSAND